MLAPVRSSSRDCELGYSRFATRGCLRTRRALTNSRNLCCRIDYNSVLRYFNGVFLNWNPALFRHHTLTHGQWPPRSDFRDDRLSIGTNPQVASSLEYNSTQPHASSPSCYTRFARTNGAFTSWARKRVTAPAKPQPA
eukprot:scaffold17572_cov32-Tisochrysis_lutea.AAC.5